MQIIYINNKSQESIISQNFSTEILIVIGDRLETIHF